MSDYKEQGLNLPLFIMDNEYIPCVGIGTYNISEKSLTEVFMSYPYKKIIIDTAYKYGNEKQVCNALKKTNFSRQDISYIGKISYAQQEKKKVEDTMKQSLNNLEIDYFDMYLIHSPRYKNYCETWNQMILLKERGFIKHIGVSNFAIEDIQLLIAQTGVVPSINQIVVNPFMENQHTSLMEYCKENNIMVQIAMPFGGSDNRNKLSDAMRRDILLDWYKKGIISIIGTSKSEHLLSNLKIYEGLMGC